MTFIIKNVKNIDKFQGKVWEYSAAFGRLLIRLYSEDHPHTYWLGFNNVWYFSGQTRWMDCNFRIGTEAELIRVMESMGYSDKQIKEHPIRDGHKLYLAHVESCSELEHTRFYVKIIAYQFKLTSEKK